jgi:hypothetical protein
MWLLAAGVPIANGVFYYPQISLRKSLDPTGQKSWVINRYQHLVYSAGELDNTFTFRIESPQVDVVRVVFDPNKFDFGLTGAQTILVPNNMDLSKNASLKLAKKGMNLSRYNVLSQGVR